MSPSRLSIALALSFILPGSGFADDAAPQVLEARAIVKGFFSQLKGELEAGMKSGGPIAAISVCNLRAPQIAAEASASSGWDVARTSLKLRNPANAADDWEAAGLREFELRKAQGADLLTLERVEIVERDGQRQFRYLKAIPVGEVCLKCHGGSEVSAETEAKLRELYPEDKARGYQLGDIRGAFTLSKDL